MPTIELTAAERLFGLASGDPWLEAPAPRRFGTRFWQCKNGLGGCEVALALRQIPLVADQLLQHERAGAMAEHPAQACPDCHQPMTLIEIVPTDERPCPWCNEPVKPGTGVALEGTRGGVALAVGVWRWYHDVCLTAACGAKVTAMATYRQTRELGPCAHCGREYQEGHTHVLGGPHPGSYCDIEGESIYTTLYKEQAAA